MNAVAARAPAFSVANQHALATILEASQTRSIIASRDIFDISGTKLWARDQPVSASLQRKLLDRQLKNPLETCLMAEDGVTPLVLVQATHALMDSDHPVAQLVKPHAAKIEREAVQLPLHSVAQLLLTAGQASRPETFDHAVQAMALAGALMLAHGGNTSELRLAMMAGLLHDLGEMYIDPRHGEVDAERTLDFESYKHLVVHPHVGHLLLAQLTDYPAAIARAVSEHHERLDGSGYPHGLQRDAVSPLGRLLAVTEGALAVLRGGQGSLARISVALRVVPGEFDLGWIGRIAEAARQAPALQSTMDAETVRARLSRLDTALKVSQSSAAVALSMAETPALKDSLGLVQHLLGRLRAGWYASGLWSTEAAADLDVAEVEAVENELLTRLQGIERAARLRAGDLPANDAQRLEALCAGLHATAP
ncbi:MAG: HD domain-containing phosphohydrolase [Rubrivivax sp.]